MFPQPLSGDEFQTLLRSLHVDVGRASGNLGGRSVLLDAGSNAALQIHLRAGLSGSVHGSVAGRNNLVGHRGSGE